ncbi:outer membrane protein [Bartonella sp. DGB2]|uniref:outer membrane protein n=1 Tax=Bartonella sp. DGB2 TaxID=3388426 RepID=UPI0039902E38
MNMKFTTALAVSVIALIGASSAYAAAPHAVVPAAPLTPAIQVPAFSWDGFYLGAQGGINFGKNVNAKIKDIDVALQADANDSSLNGLFGDIFAGYNINLGSSLVFGLETDLSFVKAKVASEALRYVFNTRKYYNNYYSSDPTTLDKNIDNIVDLFSNPKANKDSLRKYLKDASNHDVIIETQSHVPPEFSVKSISTLSFEQQWSGATRARLGFVVDRVMPYISGGVAYTSVKADRIDNDTALVTPNTLTGYQNVLEVPLGVKGVEFTATKTLNNSQTLLGFTVGAGFDFAITDNVLARAEYRYNDFGSKDFTFSDANKVKYALKDQDIRVGIAFKF